eukprot:Plantae.Rhodophyta-Hildenbrandia_rubra.ctg2620.p1 GENE.Plantae.Rhodophyta-Hildenbrandia_rubra.ctg2620~~Plantae.Rhodophyta-Hildenbrandia_rubra.ctg2620.p1  ORF type:complete len:834 (+),score=129.66 Plantae.Rhodophyta-Hildenbrandia_rubra.ctg2620:315-2816(+)
MMETGDQIGRVDAAYILKPCTSLFRTPVSGHKLCRKRPRSISARSPFSRVLASNTSWRSCPLMLDSCPAQTADIAGGYFAGIASTEEGKDAWKDELREGRVVEIWYNGRLRFGIVREVGVKNLSITCLESGSVEERKADYGEVVGVWPPALGTDDESVLRSYIEKGLELIQFSKPRTLNVTKVYNEMKQFRKGDARGAKQSTVLAKRVFPLAMSGEDKRQAAATAATAILIANNDGHFKRAAPGCGWRALPPSVVESKRKDSFIHTAKQVIEGRSKGADHTRRKEEFTWNRDDNELLRSLEMVAASGADASGTVRTVLEMLGFAPSGRGAAEFLSAVGYWSKPIHQDGDIDGKNSACSNEKHDSKSPPNNLSRSDRPFSLSSNWLCSSAILTEADELRSVARRRRSGLLHQSISIPNYRRDLTDGDRHKVYCIDEPNSRFFDDAVSIERIGDGSLVQVSLHIADVDETIHSGSPIDILAKERGKSLYFPLNPLHMIPAKAMEAAAFSPSLPTEAITITIEVDLESERVVAWEIYASVVPAVDSLTYFQFDRLLNGEGASKARVTERTANDLLHIVRALPVIVSTFDRRYEASHRSGAKKEAEGKIASVRLVRQKGINRNGTKDISAGVVVREFKNDGAHAVIAGLLCSAGSLFRMYASKNAVALPEAQGADKFASRCGTAPLRRYTDLAVQRQVKALLMHRQPAGRRRMQELRVWLAKRQNEGDRAVASQRRNALFDSFAAHCDAQKRASGFDYALVKAKVKSSSVHRKRVPRANVLLESTGITASATVSHAVLAVLSDMDRPSLPVGAHVQVKVMSINLSTFHIKAEIIKLV